jgi:predicted nucleic acid-binding protein
VIVVADTTPLIALSRLGLLDVLRQLYGTVVLPTEVWHELVAYKPDAPGVEALRAASWLQVDASADASPLLAGLREELDRGEAAAIALALVRRADVLLIDERDGRRSAEARGLAVRGTVGVLIAARERGILPKLRPVLDALLASGFRVDRRLYRVALELVGETAGVGLRGGRSRWPR